jgi:ankyrin repeat protein
MREMKWVNLIDLIHVPCSLSHSLSQNGLTLLHRASMNGRLGLARYLVEQCGADVHAKDSKQHTALDRCITSEHAPIAAFLRQHSDHNPKMYALCMGLHCRLGVDSPLNMLNVDVMQEIGKHLDL